MPKSRVEKAIDKMTFSERQAAGRRIALRKICSHATAAVLAELCARKGFDDLIFEIREDSETYNELFNECVSLIYESMFMEGRPLRDFERTLIPDSRKSAS